MLKKMQDLVIKLNNYAYEYYVLDSPTVSDLTYDKLYDELAELERQSGTVLSDSPTRRVGDKLLKGFKKHTHLSRLLSLDKATDSSAIERFYERCSKIGADRFTVEYKFDGLTVCLTYKDGYFISAATRGNGSVGENITEQVLKISTFPLSIDYKGTVEIQGEAVISLSNFEKYNKENAEQLKTPRNAAAGAVRNLDTAQVAKRGVEILFYNVNYLDDLNIDSQSQSIEFLKKNKFKVYPFFRVCQNLSQIEHAIDEIRQNRQKIDYLTDGAVIKTDSFEIRKLMGETEKFPKWAIAYKFSAEEAQTEILDIIWQVGRTGKLTPLALVAPVDLGGATVQRATLNNYGDILRKDVFVGSIVNIRRSNDVIPEILGAVDNKKAKNAVEKPTACPICQTTLEEIGANLFCVNFDCPSRAVSRLVHYASKAAADIAGLSEKTALLLFEKLRLDAPRLLYNLRQEDLQELDGFKQKKIENLLNSINNSRNIEFSKFIYSLGIEGVGIKTAKDLAQFFNNLQEFMVAGTERLKEVAEVGEVLSENIVNYFKDRENIRQLDELLTAVNIVYKDKDLGGKLQGQHIVLTGTLENYTRSGASKLIEELGGTVQSAVTEKTTLVIAGQNAGSKLKKAQEKGIKIIDESQFSKLIKS